MVKNSVLVRFGPDRTDQELIPLGRLARENPAITPADPDEWELPESSERPDS